jgi:hypothetical protein
MYTLAVDHEVAIDGTLICSYGTVAWSYSNLHVLLFLHVQILFFMSMGEQSLVKTLTVNLSIFSYREPILGLPQIGFQRRKMSAFENG